MDVNPTTTEAVNLDDYLNADFDALMEGETEIGAVKISTDPDATRVMRRYAQMAKQRAANDAIAEAEIDRITAWNAEVNRPLINGMAFLQGILESYALHVRSTEGRKTVSLPYGKIATREVQPKWQVTDRAAFEAWALENHYDDTLLRKKYEPEMGTIKEYLVLTEDGDLLTPSGEPVPGITVDTSVTASAKITPTL